MSDIDDNGNHSMDFESTVDAFLEVPATDGHNKVEAPKEEPKQEDSSNAEVEKDDEFDSIIDDLTDDDKDAGDEPEDDLTEEEVVPDDAQETFKYKVDGEEHELTTKELHDLRKDAGRSKALTQKEQGIAEERKRLDSESEAVAWAKQGPEQREIDGQIKEANEAILRGFTFDADGNQIPLSRTQIEDTQANVRDAQAKLLEMNRPPRLDDLRKELPQLFSDDPVERQSILDPFSETLRNVGYSEAELTTQNDPRMFFLLKELHEARDVVARVEKAKARRTEKKPAIASKTTKTASNGSSSKSQPKQSKSSTQDIWNKVAAGEASPADLFMD